MPITVQYDDSKLVAKIGRIHESTKRALVLTVGELRLELVALIQQKLSGQVLKVQTGDLRRSITSETIETASSVIGRAFSRGDVKYAAIHEFGGVINHPGGTPYIVTKQGAQFISTKAAAMMDRMVPVTKPHEINMPERSFMRSSLKDMRPEIVRRLATAVKGAAKHE